MTWSAPSERTRSTLLVLHTPVTSAPSALAICTANVPTPPDAPMISTLLPRLYLPVVAHGLQGGERRRRGRPRPARRRCSPACGRACPPGRRRTRRTSPRQCRTPRRPTREPGHGLADRLDAACDLPAPDSVLRTAEPVTQQPHRVRQAGHDVPGAPVHAGRVHPQQHLARRRSSACPSPQVAARPRARTRSGPGPSPTSSSRPRPPAAALSHCQAAWSCIDNPRCFQIDLHCKVPLPVRLRLRRKVVKLRSNRSHR